MTTQQKLLVVVLSLDIAINTAHESEQESAKCQVLLSCGHNYVDTQAHQMHLLASQALIK